MNIWANLFTSRTQLWGCKSNLSYFYYLLGLVNGGWNIGGRSDVFVCNVGPAAFIPGRVPTLCSILIGCVGTVPIGGGPWYLSSALGTPVCLVWLAPCGGCLQNKYITSRSRSWRYLNKMAEHKSLKVEYLYYVQYKVICQCRINILQVIWYKNLIYFTLWFLTMGNNRNAICWKDHAYTCNRFQSFVININSGLSQHDTYLYLFHGCRCLHLCLWVSSDFISK